MSKLILLLLFCCTKSTTPYSTGAPPSQCGSMTPSHNQDPQTTQSPYLIEVSPTKLKGGESVRIKLTGSTNFIGFLSLVVPSSSPSSNGVYGETSTAAGEVKLTSQDSQLIKCHKIPNSAVTHTNKNPKSSVEYEWVAPVQGGEYVVLATFVSSFSSFWVRQPSQVITVEKGTAAPSTPGAPSGAAPSPPTPLHLAKYYEECGKTKGCFGLPSGCVTARTCEILTTFEKRGESYKFELIGGMIDSSGGYLASGLSFDEKMTDSSIVACTKSGDSLQVRAFYSIASPGNDVEEVVASTVFLNPSSSYTEGLLTCTFERVLKTSIPDYEFNLEADEYKLLLSRGAVGGGDTLLHHSTRSASASFTKLSVPAIVDEGEEDEIRAKFYNGCGSEKSCFGLPVGCLGNRNCLAMATWNIDLEFQLLGEVPPTQVSAGGGYVALGLSFDERMGQDSLQACVLHDDNRVLLGSYYNLPSEGGELKMNERMESPTAGLVPPINEGSYYNGYIYCEYKRSPLLESPTELNATFSLESDEYYLLVARSHFGSSEQLAQHQSHPHHRALTPHKVKLTSPSPILIEPLPPNYDYDELLHKFYSGCGETKSCFALPHPNCIQTKNCELLVTFNQDLEFELMGRSSGYIATGLSTDDEMGQDTVIGCWLDGAQPRVGSYYNVIDGKQNLGFTNDPLKGLSPSNSMATVQDGWMFCEFTRTSQIGGEELGREFDLERDDFHILLSRGESAGVGFLSRHPTTSDRGVSPNAVNLAWIGILGVKSNVLVELHGAFMIFAWLLTASSGMFTARYYKQTHTGVNPLNKAFWFVLHISCMFTTVFLTVCAIVFIFIEVGGYSKDLEGAGSWHPVLGLILAGLALCQVLIAFFRPHPGTKNRPLFNWIHWSIGNSAHIVGVACIFLSEQLSKSGMKDNRQYFFTLVGFVVFHVAMHVVMSIHTVWADKQMNASNRMRAVRPGPMKPSGKSEEAPGTSFRTALLLLYVSVSAGVAISLVYQIADKL